MEYQIARMSLERRGRLLEAIYGVMQESRFQEASTELADQLRAGMLRGHLQRAYVRWGLLAVRNLTIDGENATPELLLRAGPEDLCEEIADAIRGECGLTPSERKN